MVRQKLEMAVMLIRLIFVTINTMTDMASIRMVYFFIWMCLVLLICMIIFLPVERDSFIIQIPVNLIVFQIFSPV